MIAWLFDKNMIKNVNNTIVEARLGILCPEKLKLIIFWVTAHVIIIIKIMMGPPNNKYNVMNVEDVVHL